jgi:branched-chain amino acid transport system substrate-binding protein
MRRLGFAAALVALVTVVALAPACAHAADVIRVGFLGPLTGIFAQAGIDMRDGLRLGFEQLGYQAAGKKIEIVEEDTEGVPATALAKYRKLVSQDKIDVLTGVLLVNIGYALAQPIERDQLPTIFLTTPDDLTKRKRTKWIVRSAFSASQPMHAFGDYAAKTLKYKRVTAVAMDNGFGHEQVGGFQRTFEELGGRITHKIFVPLNAMDFAPYLGQIPRDTDAVLAVFVGGQTARFIKQYSEYGLKARIPLLGGSPATDEHVLRTMTGDEALGILASVAWSDALDSPSNRAFVKLVESKLGKTPAFFHLAMYSAARWIAEAAKATGGAVDDREKFAAAIRRASETVEDPRGPIKLDEYGNPTQNFYITRVERVGGRLQNTPIHTYPMVSQFWTYRPEEFLRAPAYGRDYPPIKP